MVAQEQNSIRHDWTREEVLAMFNQPFNDLLFDAQVMHRRHFNPTVCSSAPCCRLKPAPALKTANTVHRAQGMTPVWKKKSFSKLKPLSKPLKSLKLAAQAASYGCRLAFTPRS